MNPDPATGPRLAIVLSHPTQYYSPWFQWLRRNTAITFRVFYLWEFGVRATFDPKFGKTFQWDVDLLSGYESEFVPNQSRHPGTTSFFGLRNPALPARVAAWRADAVLLFGYRYATHLGMIGWARRHGIPLLFRGDSHLLGRPAPGAVSRLALGLLYRRFRAFLYVGEANREYFRAFGVPEDRLFFSPHCVNEDHFRPTDQRKAEAAVSREKLDLGVRKVILFAGKLVPEKQPLELLQSFVAAPRPDAALVFVGEGETLPALQHLAARHPDAVVRFLPFANQSEMPARYLLADIFALPSRGLYETWGLAVNEAMHMGIPCLVSTRVGCQPDLVTDGQTGWVFDPSRPEDLSLAVSRSLADIAIPRRRADLQRAVAERVSGYTYQKAAEGVVAALAALQP